MYIRAAACVKLVNRWSEFKDIPTLNTGRNATAESSVDIKKNDNTHNLIFTISGKLKSTIQGPFLDARGQTWVVQPQRTPNRCSSESADVWTGP